jgi:parallel beta-helix repeat protein
MCTAVAFLLLLIGGSVSAALPRSVHATSRTIHVTGSLQTAINAAQPGDVLTLQPRTYAEKITIKRAGTATAPITIQGAGRGVSVLRGKITFSEAAAFWVLQDVDVNVNGDDDAVRLNAPTHDLILRRVHFYNGTGYGVRIGSDTTNVLIEECEIDRFDAGSRDAHGIGIMTASNITIRRCDIHHNSGDGIQTNTNDYPGYGRFASNILIENNRLHDNRENALDVKSTHGLTARNNQLWGYRVVNSSDGMAIQVQHDAQDIVIVGNQVWDSVQGIEVTRGSKNGTIYPAAPQRITIAGNLFHDLAGVPPGGGGGRRAFVVFLPVVRGTITSDPVTRIGIVVRGSSNVRVYNNTVFRGAQIGLLLAPSSNSEYPRAVDVRNNVLDGYQSDLALPFDPQKVTNLTVDYNHYVSGRVNNGALSTWLGKGYERHATSGDPDLDAALRPRSNSPLRDSGIDVGLPFSGSAPDRGWGELGGSD